MTREQLARRRADIAAYDRMVATRPLRPPPIRFDAPVMTAGAAELAREIRRGTYHELRGARLFGSREEEA